MDTKISLIMSVYNGEEYLSEAIESVLNQTFGDFELIVINDCSTDGTGEILNRYAELDNRVKVYNNEVNLRLPSSLNKAISFAQGKYIARMDADDICLPDRLEKQYSFMEKNPDTALSSCRYMTLKNGVVSSGGCGGLGDNESLKALLLVTNPILHPGIIAKADVIRNLGYDKNFTCTEDLELWTRFIMAGYNIEIIPEYLMIYRLHDKQITSTTLKKQHEEVTKVQRAYYSELLEVMSEEQEEFYIRGIYFREKPDIKEFCKFFKWAESVNSKKKIIDKKALNYAFLEILAEYKRNGLSASGLLKGMSCFNPVFILKELMNRKKRANADGRRCIESAKSMGLKQTGGTTEYPVFSKS